MSTRELVPIHDTHTEREGRERKRCIYKNSGRMYGSIRANLIMLGLKTCTFEFRETTEDPDSKTNTN